MAQLSPESNLHIAGKQERSWRTSLNLMAGWLGVQERTSRMHGSPNLITSRRTCRPEGATATEGSTKNR